MLASSAQWTQQHIGFEQSEDKVNERFSWYTLLNHLTCDVSVWLQSASLDVICQLSCQMMAQVHLSVQISLVNFHFHHLSCNMSAQLHSIAQMTSCQLCLADQHLGCNQSSLAAMCEYFGSARTQIVSWDATRKISTQLPLPAGLHMISFSVLCERLVQSVSCANAMSAQLQCFSSNVSVHCVHQMTASG